jgi:glycosyltransferase involved in cell wall biosynthesis
MRVLILSQGIPFPPVGGGLLRTYHLLRALAEGNELTLVGFSYGEPVQPAPFRVEVVGVPWEWPPLYHEMMLGAAESSRDAFERLLHETAEPWFASCIESPAMERALEQVARPGVDLCLIEGSAMARFLPCLPPGVPKILDLLDVHSLMARRAWDRAPPDHRRREGREAERAVGFEKWAASQCDLCLTVSDEEAAAARSLLGIDHVRVIPNGVDTSLFTPAAGQKLGGRRVVFVGRMNYPPNVEGVRYFAERILPLVREDVPRVEFHVVGTDPTKEVTDLAAAGVVVHGRVPDVRPHYRTADVVVVPLLSGGGTRVKVLEAAACGKAIVTTAFAVEGLAFHHGEEVIVADSPAEFAQAVVRLLTKSDILAGLGRRAREVAVRYDWDRIGLKVRQLLEQRV